MSKIISKTFDKSKKILRAIFLGSPNLFTTADLNRQIEAFERRLADLETHTSGGVTSDLQLKIVESDGYNVVYSLSYLEVFGCVLHSGQEISGVLMSDVTSEDTESVYLWYKTKTVTYTDDTTHEISGVKFEDGTSKAAADHLVIDSWGITAGLDSPLGSESLLLCSNLVISLGTLGDDTPANEVTYFANWRQRHSESLESRIHSESKSLRNYTDSQVSSLERSFTAKEYVATYTSTTSPLFSVEVAIRYNGHYGYLDVMITDVHLAGNYELSLTSTQFTPGYNTDAEDFATAWRWAWNACGITNSKNPFFFGGTPDGTWVSFGRKSSNTFVLKTSTTQSKEGEYYLRIPLLPKSY